MKVAGMWSIFFHKRLEKNLVDFFSFSERVASVIFKLNKRYNLKMIQVYVPISSYSDKD